MAPEVKRIISQVCGMRGVVSSKNEDRLVEILMAVYNGEKYIGEQIDSILSQTYQNWFLVIRDDGSTDETVDIIGHYIRQHPQKIKLISGNGNHIGSSMSFSRLLEHSEAVCIMLCDQDDVWLPDKINLSLQKLRELEEKYGNQRPLLVFTDLVVVDSGLNVIHDSFWDYQRINPDRTAANQLIVENVVTGCTMMMNAALRRIVRAIHPNAIMHDQWIALVCSVFGAMDYVKTPTVLYRQHGVNQLGARRWNIIRMLKEPDYFHAGIRRMRDLLAEKQVQAAAFYETYKDSVTEEKKAVLDFIRDYSQLSKKNFFQRISFLARNKCFCNHILKTCGVFSQYLINVNDCIRTLK